MRTPDIIKVLHILTAFVLCCASVHAVPAGEHLKQAVYIEEMHDDLAAALSGYDEVLEDVPASSD